MKTTILISMLILLNSSCKNDDDMPVNPVDALPPATQIGAQTFGCLVDGKVFLPKDFGINRLNAFNQNIDGKFTLVVSSANNDGIEINLIGSRLDSVDEIKYPLISEADGKFSAIFIAPLVNDILDKSTTNEKPGSLTITHHDPQNFILSGTFEFTVLDNDGKEIKITDGRFDVKYTN